jgi:hypothetical protein
MLVPISICYLHAQYHWVINMKMYSHAHDAHTLDLLQGKGPFWTEEKGELPEGNFQAFPAFRDVENNLHKLE